MREIKFRGKTKHNIAVADGKWAFGSLVNNLFCKHPSKIPVCQMIRMGNDGDCWEDVINDEEESLTEVDPETVGQFTTRYDINGNEIYEGDILQPEVGEPGVVYYYHYKFILIYPNYDNAVSEVFSFEKTNIIGNVHDNPELIDY